MVPLYYQEIKFAAGPFILANHADIKSLKALRVAPAGAPLNTSLRQDIVLQLCFHPLPPLVLSSCCFEPQHQTVMRHFIRASPTPMRNRVLILSPVPVVTVLRIGRTFFSFLGWQRLPQDPQGSRAGAEPGPHFISLGKGFKSHLLDGNYLDLLGKAGAAAGCLPICQLLAN